MGETHRHLYFPPADLAGTVSPKQGFKLSPQKRERDSVRSCIRPPSNANQLGQAKSAEGIKILQEIAAKEEGTFAPDNGIPAHEMLGDMLMEMNSPQEALREYQSELKLSPNRFGSLAGAAIAAEFAMIRLGAVPAVVAGLGNLPISMVPARVRRFLFSERNNTPPIAQK